MHTLSVIKILNIFNMSQTQTNQRTIQYNQGGIHMLFKSLQLRPLFQRKLWKLMRKKTVYDKRAKLYTMNQDWLKIRKQKDRRRRRVLTRLWKASQLAMLKRMYNQAI
jgi:hypothetical protein